MPKISLAIVAAAYALCAFGRATQLVIAKWGAGLPMDMLFGESIAEGLSWPATLVFYIF
ncbi:MAG: hypothetical protein GY791_11695 [Alphaproteobacteria bacterium]|nr:hypothetical protein [Alphaproteobacteria bacterium]